MDYEEIDEVTDGWVTVTISKGGDLPYPDKPYKMVAEYRFNQGPNATYDQWHATEDEAREHSDDLLEKSEKLHKGKTPRGYGN